VPEQATLGVLKAWANVKTMSLTLNNAGKIIHRSEATVLNNLSRAFRTTQERGT